METTTMRTEEKPMIARDESLRAAAASLHAAADALLAALSPAPVPAATVPTPAYPVDDKGRPLWVRFVADHSNDKAMPRRVLEWDGDVATVEGISPHRKPNGCKPSAKAGEWEPCAAPAEPRPALVPVAPASGAPAPLPGAPLAAPSRPEWVKLDAAYMEPRVRRVLRWTDGGSPVVLHSNGKWELPPIHSKDWEPCAAPSAAKGSDTGTAAAMPGVSPAATPAAWVPSVGDVVKQMTETDAVATTGAIRVVVSTDPLRWVYVENGAKVGGAYKPKKWADEVRFVRRATSAERAAAGLPVDESATKPVDRVALAKVLYVARWPDENPAKLDADSQHLDGWLRTADAAIRFFKARGGAS